jgi:ketopantoate reductase
VGIKDVMRDVVAECLAVAKAEGVEVAGDVHAAVDKLAGSMPNQYASTAQDLARGKPTEIDYLNGLIVKRGDALGVPVPANRVLVGDGEVAGIEVKAGGRLTMHLQTVFARDFCRRFKDRK